MIVCIDIAKGLWPPKFLAYLIILCFEKRRPKQKYCFSPKSNIFPKKIWSGYATGCMGAIWRFKKL